MCGEGLWLTGCPQGSGLMVGCGRVHGAAAPKASITQPFDLAQLLAHGKTCQQDNA